MTPCRRPTSLRFLRLAVPRFHSLFSLPDGRVHRQGLELVTRYLRSGIRRGANRVLPSSWGTSVIRSPCSIPTPAELLMSDHCDTAARPLVCKQQRLPRKVFRSSIAWHSDWLSTLRSADYSHTTQDSLPVAGQALPDGVLTRKVPLKGFKVADYISFPFPMLCLAQLHRPKARSISAKSHRSFHLCVERDLHRPNGRCTRPPATSSEINALRASEATLLPSSIPGVSLALT